MSGTSRFGMTNLIYGSTLKSGTGGGAPAVDEDVNFPEANCLKDDRLVKWRTSSSISGNAAVDIDLGANKSLNAASVHGIRGLTAVIERCDVSGTTVHPYDPTHMTDVILGSIGSVGDKLTTHRDMGITFGAQSLRYLRFGFAFSGFPAQFEIGKLFAGTLTDLGYVADSGDGYEIDPQESASIVRMPSGVTTKFYLGDNWSTIRLKLSMVSLATKTSIWSLLSLRRPFVYVDVDDVFYDVIVANGIPTKYPFRNVRAPSLDLIALP